jgi:hypothetical protein
MGTTGKHPAARPRNENRGGTISALGEGRKIFKAKKTTIKKETRQQKIIFYIVYFIK